MTKPKWTNITVRLGDLKPWMDNPRLSTKKQAERIIKSFEKFGQVITVAVDPDLEVLDGHQRLGALLTLHGEDYKIEARQSDRKLSEEERLDLAVSLHAGATGSWDWQKLSSFPAPKLIEMGFDGDKLKDWNNNANNLKELLNSEKPEPVDAPAEIDRAAELQEKWQTSSGQLWKLGEHRLLIGDCTVRENVERLMGGERAGACVTDSPYGINREGIENDDPEGLRALFDGCLAVMPIDNGVIINFQSPRLFPAWLDAARSVGHKFERALWMNKPNDANSKPWRGWLMVGEIIIISSVGKPEWKKPQEYHHDCYTVQLGKQKDVDGLHTTPKPPEVVSSLLDNADGIVYEPFAGSGTTIIAAHNLNRRCFAMEISEKYGAVILERFATATGITPELVTE